MPITTCTVTGNIQNLLGSNVESVQLSVSALAPFVHTASIIVGQISSTTTDSDGNFEIDLIETETVGQRLNFVFTYSDGSSGKKKKQYNLVVPDEASANIVDLIDEDVTPITTTTFPASNVTVTPTGNLIADDAQSALEELQGDIDTINSTIQTKTLADGKIWVGNGSNVATAVNVSGDISLTNAGVAAIASGVIVDADVNASAAIARSKVASGTADHVIINSGTGALSSEATLATSRGGTNTSSYTTGDVLYASSSSVLSKLAIGSTGQALKVSGGLPAWAAADVAPTITGTRASPSSIVAGTGVAFTGTAYNNAWFIQGSGGSVTVSANPQIAAGTNVGQRLHLIGRSDSSWVQFANGTGLLLNGTWRALANSMLGLFWDGTAWVEESRNDI